MRTLIIIMLMCFMYPSEPIVIFKVFSDGLTLEFDNTRTTENEAIFEVYKQSKAMLIKRNLLIDYKEI